MHRRAAALCWFPPDSAVAIAADSIDPWLIAYTASLLLLLFLLLLHTSVTGLKNFTGDSRYDFCCCAVSSTHCYLQCLLRALSWVVAHPDTSATRRSSESSSSSSSSSSVVTSVYNGCCQFVSIVRVASTALPLCVATLSSCTACPEPLESVWVVCVCST